MAARILLISMGEFSELLRMSEDSQDLDLAAAKIVQAALSFRSTLQRGVVHLRAVCKELDYDGPACMADGGDVTQDIDQVNCSKCRRDAGRA
jgi:hypothetical protein